MNPLISPLRLAIMAALFLPALAFANDAVTTLPAISVTADKIERAVEKVPISMTVLDGTNMEQSGITGMEQLEARVPSLAFQPYGQRGTKMPVMRGLTGSIWSFSTSVLMLVDDVPMLMPQGFENSFLDLERIEVLRGPQSTLYGRNAQAGVIAIHSRPMDNTERGSVSIEAGNQDKSALRFALAQPLVEDTLYASLSGSYLEQDGFVRNTHKGGYADDYKHKYLNAGVRWTPVEAVDLVLRYSRQDYDDGSTPWGDVNAPRATVSSDTPSWNDSSGQTFSLNGRFALTDTLRLRAITAYNDFEENMLQDSDFTSAPTRYIGRNNQFRTLSQEVRLEGMLGAADWLVGAYGERGNHRLHNFNSAYGTRNDYPGLWRNRTAALFTHWNIPFNAAWGLAAGARVERNSTQIHPEGAAKRKKDWTHFSPKLALQYQMTPAHQWYVSASRGIRAGGYNIFANNANYPAYAPEENWAYETGFKGFALNQRLRYSAAVYYMDIDKMQVQQQPAPGVTYISNAATASSTGVELDLDYLIGQWLGGNWQVQGGAAWHRTRFDRFVDGANNYKDKHNPFAPIWNGYLALRHDANWGGYAQLSTRASGKMYMDAANQYQRKSYALLDMVMGYQRDYWDVAIYGQNLADKHYDATGYQGGYVTVYSPPCEYGLRITWRM